MGIEWASPRPSQRRALRALRRVHAAIISSLPQGDESEPGAVCYAPGSTFAERSPSAGARRDAGGLDLGRSPSRTFSAGSVVAPATRASCQPAQRSLS